MYLHALIIVKNFRLSFRQVFFHFIIGCLVFCVVHCIIGYEQNIYRRENVFCFRKGGIL